MLAAVAVLSGCQGDEDEQRAHAAAAVETFVHACVREEDETARELLTTFARRGFVGGDTVLKSCAHILAVAPAHSEEEAKKAFEEAKVTEVTAGGGFATVGLELPSKHVMVPVERVRDTWLIADPEDPGAREEG